MNSSEHDINTYIKQCYVEVKKLSMLDYDSDSSVELPPLPYLVSTRSSKPKSEKSTAELLKEHQTLAENVIGDTVSENNIEETLKRLETMEIQRTEDSSAPISPAPSLNEEKDFNIFCAVNSLQFFNMLDVTPPQCGYEKRCHDSFPVYAYEKEMLSFKRVEFEHVISSFLFSSKGCCISDCKSFITYLLRNLSVHGDVACIRACYNVLISLLSTHPDAKTLTFSSAEIFMLLFNYGIDIDNFKLLEKWPDIRKSLEVPQYPTTKNYSKIPTNWIDNFQFMLKAVGKLVSTCKFDDKDVCQIILFFLWLSLDSTLLKENLYSAVRECIYAYLEYVPDERWNNMLFDITNTVISMEFSSLQEKWDKICHITECVPNRSLRGIQLRRQISFSALKCLCPNDDELNMDENCIEFNLSMLHHILQQLIEMDSSLLSYATKFVDFSIAHLDATEEDYKELCNTLKQCEACLNEKENDVKTTFMKIHAKLMSYTGGSYKYMISSHKSLIKQEVYAEFENQDELNTFNIANIKVEPAYNDNEPSEMHNSVHNSEDSDEDFHTPDSSEDSHFSSSHFGDKVSSKSSNMDMLINSEFVDESQPSSSIVKNKSPVKIVLKRKKRSHRTCSGESIENGSLKSNLNSAEEDISKESSEFECELVDTPSAINNVVTENSGLPEITEVKSISTNVIITSENYVNEEILIQEDHSVLPEISEVKSVLPSDMKEAHKSEQTRRERFLEVENISLLPTQKNLSSIKSDKCTTTPLVDKISAMDDDDIVIVKHIVSPKKEKLPAKSIVGQTNNLTENPEIIILEKDESMADLDDDCVLINESKRQVPKCDNKLYDSEFTDSSNDEISLVDVVIKMEPTTTGSDNYSIENAARLNSTAFSSQCNKTLDSVLEPTNRKTESPHSHFNKATNFELNKTSIANIISESNPATVLSNSLKGNVSEILTDELFYQCREILNTLSEQTDGKKDPICSEVKEATNFELKGNEISLGDVASENNPTTIFDNASNQNTPMVRTKTFSTPCNEISAVDVASKNNPKTIFGGSLSQSTPTIQTETAATLYDEITVVDVASESIPSSNQSTPIVRTETVSTPCSEIVVHVASESNPTTISDDFSNSSVPRVKTETLNTQCSETLNSLLESVNEKKESTYSQLKEIVNSLAKSVDVQKGLSNFQCNEILNSIIESIDGLMKTEIMVPQHSGAPSQDETLKANNITDLPLKPTSVLINEQALNAVSEHLQDGAENLDIDQDKFQSSKYSTAFKRTTKPVHSLEPVLNESDHLCSINNSCCSSLSATDTLVTNVFSAVTDVNNLTDNITNNENLSQDADENLPLCKDSILSQDIDENLEFCEDSNTHVNDVSMKPKRGRPKTRKSIETKNENVSKLTDEVIDINRNRSPLVIEENLQLCEDSDIHVGSIKRKRGRPKTRKSIEKKSEDTKTNVNDSTSKVMNNSENRSAQDVDKDMLFCEDSATHVKNISTKRKRGRPRKITVVKKNIETHVTILKGKMPHSSGNKSFKDVHDNLQSCKDLNTHMGDSSIGPKRGRPKKLIMSNRKAHVRKQSSPSKKKLKTEILMSRMDFSKADKSHIIDPDVADTLKDLIKSTISKSELEASPKVSKNQSINECYQENSKSDFNQSDKSQIIDPDVANTLRDLISSQIVESEYRKPPSEILQKEIENRNLIVRKSFPKRKGTEFPSPSSKIQKKGSVSNENQNGINMNKPFRSPNKYSPKVSLSSVKFANNKSPKKFFDYLQRRQKYNCLKKSKCASVSNRGIHSETILKENIPSSVATNAETTDSDSDVMELYTDPKRYADKECLVIFESEDIVIIDSD